MSKYEAYKIIESSTCFVSGLSITAPEKWQEVEIEEGYYASFVLIGENVFLTSPRGNCGLEGIPKFLELRAKFMEEMGLREKPYVEIKDYSRIPRKTPQKAVEQFTEFLKEETMTDEMKGFIPFSTSIAVRLFYNLGAKFVKTGVLVVVVDDYKKAIARALSELKSVDVNVFQNLKPLKSRELGEITLGDNYLARFKLLGDDILFNDAKGELLAEYVEGFFEGYEKILVESGLMDKGFYYRIVNWKELKPTRWKVRKVYTEVLAELNKKCSLRHSVFYNVSPFMKGILSLSQKFVSTTVTSVDTYDEAIAVINKRKEQDLEADSRKKRRNWFKRRRLKKIYSHDDVEEMSTRFLEYIGSVDWMVRGVPEFDVNSDNPLAEVYEAIKVIKLDYDNLSEEKDKMYLQVVQSSKMASLGIMGAGVAHELNNPLAAVLGFAQLIRTLSKEDNTVDSAKKIEKASLRMKTIVNHLRDFSRESKKKDWKEIDIFQPIDNALVILGAQLMVNNIVMDIERREELPKLWGDAIQLESVFQNLIVNSKDAFLSMKSEIEKKISITIEERNKGLMIQYRDNAGGMSDEVKKKIFDPFFTTKEIGAGTGLGMSVSHGIVSKHQGTITIDSVEGEGTEFQIYLPFDRRAVPREPN